MKDYNLINRISTLYTTLEPPPLSASTDTRTSQFSAIYLLFQADHTVGKMYLCIPLDSLNFPFVQRCKQFHLVIKKNKAFWMFIITISCLIVRVLHFLGGLITHQIYLKIFKMILFSFKLLFSEEKIRMFYFLYYIY